MSFPALTLFFVAFVLQQDNGYLENGNEVLSENIFHFTQLNVTDTLDLVISMCVFVLIKSGQH